MVHHNSKDSCNYYRTERVKVQKLRKEENEIKKFIIRHVKFLIIQHPNLFIMLYKRESN